MKRLYLADRGQSQVQADPSCTSRRRQPKVNTCSPACLRAHCWTTRSQPLHHQVAERSLASRGPVLRATAWPTTKMLRPSLVGDNGLEMQEVCCCAAAAAALTADLLCHCLSCNPTIYHSIYACLMLQTKVQYASRGPCAHDLW